MKYTIKRTDESFEMIAQSESGDPLFQGEFGLTGQYRTTEPREALEAAYMAAREALRLNNPAMEKKRRSET